MITPEHAEALSIQDRIRELQKQEAEQAAATNAEIARLQKQEKDKQAEIDRLNLRIASLSGTISERESRLVLVEDELNMQEVGFFKPQYEMQTAEAYKVKLAEIRAKQKDAIKGDRAVTGAKDWTVNGNAAKGKKMVSDTQKLLLRAFNTECDELIDKVKYSNFEASHKRIEQSATAISKLGTVMQISITNEYLFLKLQELRLAFEYQVKKQEEKEEQKELRAQMREEAKAQKELEAARKKSEKEQSHYLNALTALNKQIAEQGETPELLAKKAEIEGTLSTIETELKELDYREANAKAGYVYIISNIGSFGKDVYKIGMTRRVEPMERIDELGDASVPFDFDVHAMIFSADAPKLEAALHNAFADRKLNMINTRREFFKVSLDEIKAVVKANYDKTANFIDIAEAGQYYQSIQMRNEN